jgi:hypothetical protein
MDTSATSLRAGAPSVPVGNLAINGAGERIALKYNPLAATCDATKVVLGDNRLGFGLGTSTTRNRASTKARPLRKFAVDWAGESAARVSVDSSSASFTTVLGWGHNGLRASLGASATRLRASTVVGPA